MKQIRCAKVTANPAKATTVWRQRYTRFRIIVKDE